MKFTKLGASSHLLLWFLLFSVLQPGVLVPSSQTARELPAVAGNWKNDALAPGEVHSYTFGLSTGKFLRIDFYSLRLDLMVSVIWPDKRKSMEWNIPKRVAAPISFITDAPGAYQLTVRSPEKIGRSGDYRIEIKTLRPSGGQDQKQVTACRRLSTAAQLRSQWTESSLRNSIREYGKALAYWEAASDRLQEAAAYGNAGEVWEILAEPQNAFANYGKARQLYREMKDGAGEAKSANAICSFHISQGEYQKAMETCTPELAAAIEDPWERAHCLHNVGAAYYGTNEMQKAARFLNEALELEVLHQDRTGQASTLLYLGYINHAVKDMRQAEQYYRQSLDLWRKEQNPRGIAMTLAVLGHLFNISGERQLALEYYDQSLAIFKTIGDPSGRCEVLEGIGRIYNDLGDKTKALQCYLEVLDLARHSGIVASEATVLNYISAIYCDLHDYKKALQYSQQSVLAYRSMPSILGESYALVNMGRAQESLGKMDSAAENYARALQLSRKGGDRFLEGLLLNSLGHLYYGANRLQKALDYCTRALTLQREANDSVRLPGTLINLARAERDGGDLEHAIEHARQGLEITESLRGKVASSELRGSYLASVHQQYEFMIDLYMQRYKQHPTGRSDAMALQASEQARARLLLDSLVEANADIREGADPALLEKERRLQELLNDRANRQMRLFGRMHSREEEATLAKEINSIAEEYKSVQTLIRGKSPHYAALTQPQPLGLREIQQSVVDDDTLLLEYALGEEHSYLWAVTPGTIRSHELPKGTEIESRTNRVRALMLARQRKVTETAAQYQQRIRRDDEEYWKEAAALSQTLLGPVADQLESHRLLVVTEGVLQYLPFGALPRPHRAEAEDAARRQQELPLIVDHEIISLPSASVLAVLRQETGQRPTPPKTVAVLADPVFDADDPRVERRSSATRTAASSPRTREPAAAVAQRRITRGIESSIQGFSVSRLPSTREEADSIMALVSNKSALEVCGFDANREFVMGPELGQYRIVHFATHGFLNDEQPELSGLVLSLVDEKGYSQDGFLRLHDIYSLKLPVELVVLSACNSGLGKEVRGEGLVGIVRGFMYAGAARVVASLWKVEDEATAALMKHFYRYMLQDGQPPAKALRMAQLDIWKQKRWQSPFYWAAFVLQGEWK